MKTSLPKGLWFLKMAPCSPLNIFFSFFTMAISDSYILFLRPTPIILWHKFPSFNYPFSLWDVLHLSPLLPSPSPSLETTHCSRVPCSLTAFPHPICV